MIQCIKKLKHILSHRSFEVHTDALALKYLTTMKNLSSLFTRWYQELAGFNFTVINKKGKEEENTFSRNCHAYPIPNKEARTVAKVLMDQHFNIYGLPDQLHSDNGKEFVNNLWRELFSEFKIQHTTTPPYNPSSNRVEHFHRTLIAMLRTRGEGRRNSG